MVTALWTLRAATTVLYLTAVIAWHHHDWLTAISTVTIGSSIQHDLDQISKAKP